VRKVTMTLTAAVLLLGIMALQASAQNQQRGAASIHALRNANPDRHAGGVLRGNRLLRFLPRLDQRVLPSLLPMRTLLVRGGSAIVPECIEAASARRPLALT
jgi:hypothetical protein